MKSASVIGIVSSILVAGAVGAGCGDNEADRAPGTGGSSSGGSATGGMGQGGSNVSCGESQEQCGFICASTESDPQHCGECDATCGAGEGCLKGVCADFGCGTGQVTCSEQCVNLQTDRDNCGDCDESCAMGEICLSGVCETSCPAGLLECDGSCIDPTTDRNNCGATDCSMAGGGGAGGASSGVGEVCAPGTVCTAGECATSCQGGTVECNGTCIDPNTSRDFCGASVDCMGANAGDSCTSGKICSAGSCESSCGANTLECGGACIDPLGDPNYCGATDCSAAETSGTVCSPLETCVIGDCKKFAREWTQGANISDPGTATGTNESEIVSDPAGNAIAVWRQLDAASPPVLGMWARRFDATSKAWGTQVRLDTTTQTGWETTNPALTVAPNGDALAAWRAIAPACTPDGCTQTEFDQILVALYTKGSDSWGPPIRMDGNTGTALETPAVAFDGQGRVHIVWSQQVQGSDAPTPSLTLRVHYRRYDTTAQDVSPVEIFDNDAWEDRDHSFTPQIVANAQGGAALAWRSRWYTNIYALVLDPNNADTWSNPKSLTPLAGDFVKSPPDISMRDDGSVYVVFSTRNPDDKLDVTFPEYLLRKQYRQLRVQRNTGIWDAASTVIQQELKNIWNPKISTNLGGDSVVGYWTQGLSTVDVKIAQFKADLTGVSLRDMRTGIAGEASLPNPQVGLSNAGFIHVAWTDSEAKNFETSRFNNETGRWIGPEVLNDVVPGSAGDPRLAISAFGHAYATWYRGISGGDPEYIFARFD